MNKNEVALQRIKAIVEACRNGSITVTQGNDDFDYLNHRYDLSVIMGIIHNHLVDAERQY